MMEQDFTETQRFNQWWLWGTILGFVLLPIIDLVLYIPHYPPIIDKNISLPIIIFIYVFPSVLFILFLIMRLNTKIDQEEISIKFVPFVTRKFKWSEIDEAKVLNYGFIGGWGVRLWTSYGTAYNVRGKMGLAIKLKNGKRYLIGTQKEEQLEAFIQQLNLQLKKD